MKVFEEVTVWNSEYRVPNHIYFMTDSKSKALAYIREGTTEIFRFRNGIKLDLRGRRFREIENRWNFVVEQEPEEQAKPTGQTWIVAGSKGNGYTVSLDGGRWSCTCPGHGFRSKCRHVDEISKSVFAPVSVEVL